MTIRDVRAVRALSETWGGPEAMERRDTFRAALDQFEEFLKAADTLGPASAPLPLFYALSQAGRAIIARARPTDWRSHSHGISARPDEHNVVDTTIRTQPDGLFVKVAASIYSEVPAPNETFKIAEIGTTLEPLKSKILGHADRPEPLLVIDNDDEQHTKQDNVAAVLVEIPRHAQAVHRRGPTATASAFLHEYPSATGWNLSTTFQQEWDSGYVAIEWPMPTAPDRRSDLDGWRIARRQLLDSIAPVGPRLHDDRWLRAPLAGATMHPLMNWWAFLYGVSSVARYSPGSWRRALNPDESYDAVILEDAMDSAIYDIPEIVKVILVALVDIDDGGFE